MITKLIDYLKDKNILILGFGLEGQSTYKLIRKHLPNKLITIADMTENLLERHDFLNSDNNLQIVSGPSYLDKLNEFELIIKSPGISLKNLDTTNLKDRITSQLELFLEFIDVYTIGITGTKGKSTTSSLIYHILTEQSVDALLLGNIGIPIFDFIEEIKEDMKVVLELSSHQLEFIRKSPNIAILLNIFEEHLDHYKSINEYIGAKFNIARYQNEKDYFIYNIDNSLMNQYLADGLLDIKAQKYQVTFRNESDADKKLYISDNNIYIKDGQQSVLYDGNTKRKLLGNHNLNNIMFALAVSRILGLDINKVAESISSFEPLSHRMEYVGCYNDIHFYNDSIATIPEATICCIESLKNVDSLIVGGMDRGVDFSGLIEYLSKGIVRNIICMPATGIYIGNQTAQNNQGINIFQVKDLSEAVTLAKEITEKDKICVLSPAAASYGFFKNFQEKGEEFKRLVRELQPQGGKEESANKKLF